MVQFDKMPGEYLYNTGALTRPGPFQGSARRWCSGAYSVQHNRPKEGSSFLWAWACLDLFARWVDDDERNTPHAIIKMVQRVIAGRARKLNGAPSLPGL